MAQAAVETTRVSAPRLARDRPPTHLRWWGPLSRGAERDRRDAVRTAIRTPPGPPGSGGGHHVGAGGPLVPVSHGGCRTARRTSLRPSGPRMPRRRFIRARCWMDLAPRTRNHWFGRRPRCAFVVMFREVGRAPPIEPAPVRPSVTFGPGPPVVAYSQEVNARGIRGGRNQNRSTERRTDVPDVGRYALWLTSRSRTFSTIGSASWSRCSVSPSRSP
jgi:hypothetical protein